MTVTRFPRLAVCLLAATLFSAVTATAQGQNQGQTPATAVRRPAGWTDATHGARTPPDYRRLFALDRVHEIQITIAPDRFTAMQADLKTLTPQMPGMGPGGRGGRPGGPGFNPEQMAAMMEAAGRACTDKAQNAACSADGVEGNCVPMFGGPLACVPPQLANMMRGGAIQLTTRDPMYVPVTVTYDGKTWTKVAMRYKGNSSLVSTVASENGKVPFRLDFDRYKREDAAIDGQRFYGFQELTFSSNFTDDSQLREVLGNEIFRDRGVPAPRAAFYRVTVDTGNGPQYWGLYTMVEDPSDGAMLDAQLGGRMGNLYKPDGPGADWTKFDKEGFAKKNNERADDFSDVQAAITALHAPHTDAAAWRTALEARFNVDLFLKWLAVNTAIDNWDTYGAMPHNYYLYGDPRKKGQLQWIPWDNNMAFGLNPAAGGGRGGLVIRRGGPPAGGPPAGGPPPGFGPPPGGGPPGGGRGPVLFGPPMSTDVLHRDAGERWPLLSILLADETYMARYKQHLVDAMGGLFAPDAFARRARQLHALVTPHVTGPRGERETHRTVSSPEAFARAVDGPGGLIELTEKRRALIRETLASAR